MFRPKIRQLLIAKSRRRYSTRHTVQVNFLRVPRVNKWPKRNPLIIVYGLFDNAGNWVQLAKMLQKKLNRQVVISELRNHGSSPHRSTMTFDEMAGDLSRVIDEVTTRLPVPRCFLLGHSLGGKVACHLALNKPLLIEKLIVEDIAPVTYPFDAGSSSNVMRPLLAMKTAEWSSEDLKEARQQVDQHFKSVGFEDSAARRFYTSNLVEMCGEIRWNLNLKALERVIPYFYTFPAEHDKKRYEGPTLFLFGETSKQFFQEERDIPIIKDLFPNVKLDYMKDCGHYMHIQKPHEFVDVVSNFIGL